MARFHGKVGFAGESEETAPGVWVEQIVQRDYFGDVIRNSRKLDEGEKVNNDISVGNSISIVADEYALNHFFAIRYVEWAGSQWTVTDVEVQRPRLILRLKGVYNGQPPAAP